MRQLRLDWRWMWLGLVVAAMTLPDAGRGQNPGQAPGTFRVMTYNIHHGEGLDGEVDLERIAALIQKEQADIVALQEVDRGVKRTAGRDLPKELATLTHMTCVFTNNILFQGGQYGNAVLSRFPVEQWTNSLLPKIKGQEQRGILQLCLKVQGRELVFLNTHLDQRLETERVASAEAILKLIQAYGSKPLLLCGDFNTAPKSQTYQQVAAQFTDSWGLAGSGEGFTIPAEKPNRRIDYIWFNTAAPLKPLKAWVPESEASDHRPVVAEFSFR